MAFFRDRMVRAIGRDSDYEGYDAIIDLTRTLNSQNGGPATCCNPLDLSLIQPLQPSVRLHA